MRFGLYACGWDLMSGTLGALVMLVTRGVRDAVSLVELAMRAPRRASTALLSGVYQLTPNQAARARRAGTAAGWALALASGALVAIAIAAAIVRWRWGKGFSASSRASAPGSRTIACLRGATRAGARE